MTNTLVTYFSCSGVTAQAAQKIARIAQADLAEIKPVEAYTDADLNWHNATSRSSLEMKDPASRPAIQENACDPACYETIFLGFPIWWYEAPRIISTFLESHDFKGKKIVVFATSGGSGLGQTITKLQGICPDAIWAEGKRVNGMSEKELTNWVKQF